MLQLSFRSLSVRSPRNSVTKYPLFPRNTLTPAPRNNVARYNNHFTNISRSDHADVHSFSFSLVMPGSLIRELACERSHSRSTVPGFKPRKRRPDAALATRNFQQLIRVHPSPGPPQHSVWTQTVR